MQVPGARRALPALLCAFTAGIAFAATLPAEEPRPGVKPPNRDDRGPVPVVDGHTHEGMTAKGGKIDVSGLSGLRARGIGAAVYVLPVDPTPAASLEARLADEIGQLREVAATGHEIALPARGARVRNGRDGSNGPFPLLLTIESRDGVFDGDLTRVRRYADLGVRMISLWNRDADGLFLEGGPPARLSPRGRKVVSALNEAGIVIDITHLSHSQKLEVIEASRAPVVASHSLAQAESPGDFNLPEEVLTALAAHDGSVWVSFNRSDLLGRAPEDEAMDRLVAQIAHLAGRLGTDRVGIGTDLQSGGRYVPAPLNRNDAFSVLRARLQEKGYPPAVVDGILGGNVLRVLE